MLTLPDTRDFPNGHPTGKLAFLQMGKKKRALKRFVSTLFWWHVLTKKIFAWFNGFIERRISFYSFSVTTSCDFSWNQLIWQNFHIVIDSSQSQNKYQCLSAILVLKNGTFFVKDLLIKVKWKFQNIEFEKKGIRNQAAEQFKIERAAGQGGIWYRFRPVSVCLDKQLPRRNKYAGTC